MHKGTRRPPCVSYCGEEGGPCWASRGLCWLWSPCLGDRRHPQPFKKCFCFSSPLLLTDSFPLLPENDTHCPLSLSLSLCPPTAGTLLLHCRFTTRLPVFPPFVPSSGHCSPHLSVGMKMGADPSAELVLRQNTRVIYIYLTNSSV